MERIYPDLPGSTPDLPPDLPSDLPLDLPGSCLFIYSSSTHMDMHVNFFLHELRLLADAATLTSYQGLQAGRELHLQGVYLIVSVDIVCSLFNSGSELQTGRWHVRSPSCFGFAPSTEDKRPGRFRPCLTQTGAKPTRTFVLGTWSSWTTSSHRLAPALPPSPP